MYHTDKCVVAQVLKVVVIINLIIIDHSRMIQAFRFIEISKYDDGDQLTTHGQLMLGSSRSTRRVIIYASAYGNTPTRCRIPDLDAVSRCQIPDATCMEIALKLVNQWHPHAGLFFLKNKPSQKSQGIC